MATKELAIGSVTPDQIDLIKKTVARGATDDELRLFFYDCARRNVHPLDKLIHFTKRNNTYTPITSIDFMRSQASDSGEYAGNDDPVFVEDEKGDPLKATVTVWRITQGQRCPYTASARWDSYYPGPGREGFMWRKMPEVMLGKCAESLALRKAFPKQLSGLYSREEMDQAGQESTFDKEAFTKAKVEELSKPVEQSEEEDENYEWRMRIAHCSTVEDFNGLFPDADSAPKEVKKWILTKANACGYFYDKQLCGFYDPKQRTKKQLEASVADLPPTKESLPIELEPISKQEQNQISAARRKAGISIEDWANIKGKYGVEHTDELRRGDFSAIMQDIKDHQPKEKA